MHGAIDSPSENFSRWCDSSEILSVVLLNTDSDIKGTEVISSGKVFFSSSSGKKNLKAKKT